MKWLAFFGMVIVGIPTMIGASHFSAQARRVLFAILIFSTCMKISVNFVSTEWYRGPDRGFEVTMTDLIATALGVSLLLRRRKKLRWLPPNTMAMAGFFVIAVISVQGSEAPLFGWFALFKLVKAYWLYWVVYNTFLLESPEVELWYGLMGIAYYETLICLKQKYLHGMYRVYGTFDHSNSIPIYLLMFLPLLLAWVLHGKHLGRIKTAVTMGALAGGCLCVLATQSRAGIVLAGAALAAVLVRVVPHRVSGRKFALACLLLIVGSLGLLKAAPTIAQRFKEAPVASSKARTEFNRAAQAMSEDHFFGVGYNLFSHAMTNHLQYKRFAEVLGNEEQAGVCHHVYYLTAAETGTIGLILYLIVMGCIQCRLFYRLWGHPDFDRSLVIGAFIGLSVVHLIGLLEWCFRLTPQMNMFMMVAAIGQAYCYHIAEREKATKRVKRRARSVSPQISPALDPRGAAPAQ